MKEYVPISKLPKEVNEFYEEYGDMYEEMIVTKNNKPLFNIIFKKGKYIIEAVTVDDLERAIDSDTLNRSYTCTPNLVSFDAETGVLNFATSCAESRNAWEQRVQFTDEWDLIPEDLKEPGTDWRTIASEFPEVKDLNCRVHCTCPYFLYGGSSYILTQLDTQLVDENRYPQIRDPQLEHTVCKHLSAVIRNFF